MTMAVTSARCSAVLGSGGGIANAEQNGTLRRADRDRLREMETRPLPVNYRERILGDSIPESAFVQSLTRPYPEATGAPPDPVTATGDERGSETFHVTRP